MNDRISPRMHQIPIGIRAIGMRRETDPMGEIEVPADRYWRRRHSAVSFISAEAACQSSSNTRMAMSTKPQHWPTPRSNVCRSGTRTRSYMPPTGDCPNLDGHLPFCVRQTASRTNPDSVVLADHLDVNHDPRFVHGRVDMTDEPGWFFGTGSSPVTLREAALASSDIDEKRFDEIVDPKKDGRARRWRELIRHLFGRG